MLPLLYCRRRCRGRLCCCGARMTERWKHSGARVPAKEPRFDSARRSSADRVSYLIPRGFSPRQVHQFFLFFKGNTSKLIVDLNARKQVERRLWVTNFCIVKGLLGPCSAFWLSTLWENKWYPYTLIPANSLWNVKAKKSNAIPDLYITKPHLPVATILSIIIYPYLLI